jgi:divalent metal cation (Fe/Co/Zn/Cd) transporter
MLLIAIAIVLFVSVVPVMIGARVVGARRNGFWICLGALLIATLIAGFAVRAFHGLGLLAIFASALGYMLVLDTTYLRGLAIAVIQGVLTVLLAIVVAVTVLGTAIHGLKDLTRQLPYSTEPAQSV